MEKDVTRQTKELSLIDFEKILPFIVPKDRPIILASDFDETCCSQYVYDQENLTHLPQISDDLIKESSRISSLFLMATARTSKDVRFWELGSKILGGRNLPVICENGAVIFFPNSPNKSTLVLLDDSQLNELERLRAEIPKIKLNGRFKAKGAEVLIKDKRLSSIDVRIQDTRTKIGIPELYTDFIAFMNNQFDLDGFTAVFSQNSLSIQPKNVNKIGGILVALKMLGINREDVFLIGMGDAENDKELLKESDLSIAVRPGAAPYAEFLVNEGDKASLALFKTLK